LGSEAWKKESQESSELRYKEIVAKMEIELLVVNAQFRMSCRIVTLFNIMSFPLTYISVISTFELVVKKFMVIRNDSQ